MSTNLILSEWEEGGTTLVLCPHCSDGYLKVTVRAGSEIYPCGKCGENSSVTVTREICGWLLFTRIAMKQGPSGSGAPGPTR
jgi:ribosomal protein L37AE/L43A